MSIRPAPAAALPEADTASASMVSPAAWLLPTAIALVLRAAILPFAEDVWGDAPVRLELARRWAQSPGIWWSYGEVYQFGPLPTHLGGLAVWLGWGDTFGPRLLSLLAGVGGVALAARVAGRLGGASAALACGLAVALSPLHLQASTTFVSESFFLFFALGCVDRALRGDLLGTALWAFAAATSRWDAWLWLPLVALWFGWKVLRWRPLPTLGAAGLLALGPLSILAANTLQGDALAPLRHVAEEHVLLASRSIERYGELGWRARMLVYWPATVLVVLTPGFGVLAFRNLLRLRGPSGAAALPVVTGVWAPMLYAGRTVVLATFWPMMRFVLAPAVLVATAFGALRPRTIGICVAVALVFNGALLAAQFGALPYGGWAAALSPVSRLPPDLRAGVDAVREAAQGLTLDRGPGYEDLFIAHHAGVDRFELRRARPAELPHRIVTFAGAELDSLLREEGAAYGWRFVLAGEAGRVSWWDAIEPLE